MSLPGKLCIGILEEDNPLKSYFRFKPLLVEEGGRYVPCAEPENYPEDGCIRIVPDKNESYHFKTRMRRIGLFCVVDLRGHPDDNDKIRPNKNYHEGGPEQNAYIIYSDVVREPAADMIFEILPEALRDTTLSEPRTANVLLRGEDLRPERYAWESLPGTEGRAQLLPTDKTCPLDRMQTFELAGFRERKVAFAIALPGSMERISDMPAPAPRPLRPAPPEGVAPHEPRPTWHAPDMQAPRPMPAPPAPRPAAPAPAAEPAPGPAPAPVAPPAPQPPADAPAAPPQPEEPADKPWIHRDSTMVPRPVDPRLSPAQRNLAIQSGLNPRRGRSLQELIDEKWQQSRLNQLGQPIAPIQTGAPLSSPVDSAVQAVRQVWNQPQLRQDLLESLGGIEEFGASLEECREAARKLDIEAHLDSLEARRLALLSELDHLTLRNADVRQSLKAELRKDEAAALAECVKRTEAAKAEQAKYEKLAGEAQAAARDARKALEDMTGEALREQLTRFALQERMVERLKEIQGEAEALPPALPPLEVLDLNALAARVTDRFEAAGFEITRPEALNLCACAAAGPALILSGPVGCGKTETARMLAGALGWDAADRFAAFAPGRGSLAEDARVAELRRLPDAPAMLLLDDANLVPAHDPLRGLGTDLPDPWRLCLTVQDGGFPLSAHVLDRGFLLRLDPKPAAPWKPRKAAACAAAAPAALALPIPDAPLPAAMETRLEALRAGLKDQGAAFSRRALDEAWRYCALMLEALGDAADPVAILDRAVAQRLLPGLLAAAPVAALSRLPRLLEGLPLSLALLKEPLPVQM